eukprot:Nitzschia sp. Nitz4//scaffold2_size372955//19985//21959//NITZ4_000355-RA/size372955-snap-gene-0.58-mRNA-1//-1//CDS//3329546572//6139//frame0
MSQQPERTSPPDENQSTRRTDAAIQDQQEPNAEENQDALHSRVQYCLASYQAVFTPVALTMIVSALTVVIANTDETRAQGEAAYAQTYEVFDLEDGDGSHNIMASLANVFIIVSVICLMTFVIVLLYKFGFSKFFVAYMVLTMTMLLGYFTSNIALVIIEKYHLRVDIFSFVYVLWNYAIVGVMAIFFNRGIPKFVTQGYLVASSVAVAWQLSYFNTWTAWSLLVMLALYDLFAVLTPCGPLKMLTGLMSRPGAQSLPGLLYEAELPRGVNRPRRETAPPQQQQTGSDPRNNEHAEDSAEQAQQQPSVERSSLFIGESLPNDESTTSMNPLLHTSPNNEGDVEPTDGGQRVEISTNRNSVALLNTETPQEQVGPALSLESADPRIEEVSQRPAQRKGEVPLAIARMYKLTVIDEEGILSNQRRRNDALIQREYTAEEIRAATWTPQQLRREVTVLFPSRGGRIVKDATEASPHGSKYLVYNRTGELLRTFVVNRQGQVLQVVRRDNSGNASEEEGPGSIKLGLGDFIFYSLLVSKAAEYSFTAFAACVATILFGLLGTLVLLSIHGKALPALPISIFLAVIAYLASTYLMGPYVHEVLRLPCYV